jgi:hypothetical protein
MSLLKIEKDGGLVGLRDQCRQNESVICGLGGFGVTHPTIAAACAEHQMTPNLDRVLLNMRAARLYSPWCGWWSSA